MAETGECGAFGKEWCLYLLTSPSWHLFLGRVEGIPLSAGTVNVKKPELVGVEGYKQGNGELLLG